MHQIIRPIQRRNFLTAAGAFAFAGPGVGAGLPRIGWLNSGTSEQSAQGVSQLRAALMALGWRDGQNCLLDFRYADGENSLLQQMSMEMARAGPTVLVSQDLSIVELFRKLAPNTPLVVSSALDPVALGYAKTLAQPGGNITGISMQADSIARKRLALLHEALPEVKRLGYVFTTGTKIDADLAEFDKLAPALGIQLIPLEIENLEQLPSQLEKLGASASAALFIFADKLTHTGRAAIAQMALRFKLPTFAESNIFARDGALMAYAADQSDNERLMAGYIDKILRGIKPGDLPISQPVNFALSLNLITANALGLQFSTTFLARADRIYE